MYECRHGVEHGMYRRVSVCVCSCPFSYSFVLSTAWFPPMLKPQSQAPICELRQGKNEQEENSGGLTNARTPSSRYRCRFVTLEILFLCAARGRQPS